MKSENKLLGIFPNKLESYSRSKLIIGGLDHVLVDTAKFTSVVLVSYEFKHKTIIIVRKLTFI